MIIGFSKKTSKILPKIFCRNFRHCIVIFKADEISGTNKCGTSDILVQIATDGIRVIAVGQAEIKKLESYGWIFIENQKTKNSLNQSGRCNNCLTCVGFAKRALGINKPFIWTPDQLYRYLIR